MVQSAVTDVIGPAVAAEDPHGLLVQVLLLGQDLLDELAGVAVAELGAGVLELLGVGLHLGQLVAEGVLGGGAVDEPGHLVDGAQAVVQRGDIGLCGLLVGLAVVHGVQPLLGGLLEGSVGPVDGDEGAGLVGQGVADGLLAQVQP